MAGRCRVARGAGYTAMNRPAVPCVTTGKGTRRDRPLGGTRTQGYARDGPATARRSVNVPDSRARNALNRQEHTEKGSRSCQTST